MFSVPRSFPHRFFLFLSPILQKPPIPNTAMVIPEDVTPQSPAEEQPVIGLIGMGAMGTMYADQLADAGWKK